MAATLTRDGEMTYVSFPVEKFEETPDGNVVVYGKASDGSLDSDEQIVDPDFAAKAIQDWLGSGGNLRVQHNPQRDPAGVGIEADTDSAGGTWVKSLVVEPIAQKLVKAGALRAYSVGIARPTIVRDSVARGGRITDGHVVEISLVDRPANKNCTLQLVKAAKDGSPEYVGTISGNHDIIRKAAGMTALTEAQAETISLELPADISVAFSPADLARIVTKKAKDPDVGEDTHPGGVDRSQLPGEDFAGRNRSFPITSPGDVSDAAQSIGRAGDDNYDAATLRENITRIAHRKGPEYVAQLPDSWSKSADGVLVEKGDGLVCDVCHGKGKIRDGNVTCPKCHGHGSMSADPKHESDDTAEKARGKSCEKCGGKLKKGSKFCSSCGAKNPWFMAKSDGKPTKIIVEGEGDKDHDGDGLFDADGDGDGAVARLPDEKDAEKSVGKACDGDMGEKPDKTGSDDSWSEDDRKNDDNDNDDDDDDHPAVKQLRQLQEQLAKLEARQEQLMKSAVPGEGVTGEVGATERVPAHREPDGAEVEAYERDSGLTDGDHEAPTRLEEPTLKYDASAQALLRLAKSGVPADMGVLHDMCCPAFSPAAVAKCYPDRNFATEINEHAWQMKSLDLAATLPFPQAARAAALAHHALTLKEASPHDVMEAREELHKAFSDANPGPGTAPTPASISPGRFNRPYLSAGHASPSTAHGTPNQTPVTSGEIQAAQFTRGPLTAGHESPSPGMASAAKAAADVGKNRTFYSRRGKDATVAAMRTIHDHIAQTFPDVCPMHGEGAQSKPDAAPASMKTQTVSHSPVHPAVTQLVRGDESPVKKSKHQRKLEKALAAEAEIAQMLLPAGAITKAATGPSAAELQLVEKVAELAEHVRQQNKVLKKQAKLIDSMAASPDPSVQAYRGGILTPPPAMTVKNASVTAAPSPTMDEVAERTKSMMLRELETQFRTAPDPALREAAWRSILQLRGVSG